MFCGLMVDLLIREVVLLLGDTIRAHSASFHPGVRKCKHKHSWAYVLGTSIPQVWKAPTSVMDLTLVYKKRYLRGKGKVCVRANCGSSGWSLSRFIKHEAARNISTPPGWDADPLQSYPPSTKFTGTHFYTWVERGTMRVKCLAQEHNIMSLARTQTRTARSGVEGTNNEVTMPSILPLT